MLLLIYVTKYMEYIMQGFDVLKKYKYDLIENCPNDKINDIQHEKYYRISKNKELTDEDFLPQYWSQPDRREKFELNGKCCEYQGLSCFATYDEAVNMSNRFALGDYFHNATKLEEYATIKDIGNNTYPTHVNIYILDNVNEKEDLDWSLENEN